MNAAGRTAGSAVSGLEVALPLQITFSHMDP